MEETYLICRYIFWRHFCHRYSFGRHTQEMIQWISWERKSFTDSIFFFSGLQLAPKKKHKTQRLPDCLLCPHKKCTLVLAWWSGKSAGCWSHWELDWMYQAAGKPQRLIMQFCQRGCNKIPDFASSSTRSFVDFHNIATATFSQESSWPESPPNYPTIEPYFTKYISHWNCSLNLHRFSFTAHWNFHGLST